MNVEHIPQAGWDGLMLRRWRAKHDIPAARAAQILEISVPSYFRIETGYLPHIHLANRIVAMTRGEIRYRDIYLSFRPEYA